MIMDKKNESPAAKPTHSKRKVLSKHVDMEPTAYASLKEAVGSDIDSLLRLGLADIGKISLYRRAAAAPKGAIGDANLRPIVADMLDRILKLIASDHQLYARFRAVLSSKRRVVEGSDVIAAALALRTESRMDRDKDPADEVDRRSQTKHKKHPRPIKDETR